MINLNYDLILLLSKIESSDIGNFISMLFSGDQKQIDRLNKIYEVFYK